MKAEEKNKVRLYRFYNFEVSKSGEPFAMCDKCHKDYLPPSNCVMTKIADDSRMPCDCGEENKDES